MVNLSLSSLNQLFLLCQFRERCIDRNNLYSWRTIFLHNFLNNKNNEITYICKILKLNLNMQQLLARLIITEIVRTNSTIILFFFSNITDIRFKINTCNSILYPILILKLKQ